LSRTGRRGASRFRGSGRHQTKALRHAIDHRTTGLPIGTDPYPCPCLHSPSRYTPMLAAPSAKGRSTAPTCTCVHELCGDVIEARGAGQFRGYWCQQDSRHGNCDFLRFGRVVGFAPSLNDLLIFELRPARVEVAQDPQSPLGSASSPRPPLWPTEVLSVCSFFSNSPSLGLIVRPGLLGILSRFLCLLEPRFSLIAFLRMVRQRRLLVSARETTR
jgi:hypothetical protein